MNRMQRLSVVLGGIALVVGWITGMIVFPANIWATLWPLVALLALIVGGMLVSAFYWAWTGKSA
jgi:hypothetical protein